MDEEHRESGESGESEKEGRVTRWGRENKERLAREELEGWKALPSHKEIS